MKFKYNARTKLGELQTGFVDSVSREAASNILISHELYVLSLEAVEKPKFYDIFLSYFKKVRREDLMVFTRQLSTLLEAEISLGDTLKNLHRQTHNQVLKEVIFEISSDVDSGLSLSQALERHVDVFSQFYISMFRSAEITGRMNEVAGFLADYLEKENTLVNKIRNALIYPGIVFVLLLVAVGFIFGFVFPQIKPIFDESGAAIPIITKIILGTSDFVQNWWFAIIGVIAVAVFIIVDYFKSDEGKIVRDELLIKLPVLGNLFRKIYIARFSESTSVLIRGGIPVAQALEISGHTVGSVIYRDAIHLVAESVREGKLMSQALEERSYYFPPLVSQMVSVGENTGRLDELLSRISSFYSKEVDNLVGNLVELIQPIVMVVIAVGVGIVFASVLLPIYGLVQQF